MHGGILNKKLYRTLERREKVGNSGAEYDKRSFLSVVRAVRNRFVTQTRLTSLKEIDDVTAAMQNYISTGTGTEPNRRPRTTNKHIFSFSDASFRRKMGSFVNFISPGWHRIHHTLLIARECKETNSHHESKYCTRRGERRVACG